MSAERFVVGDLSSVNSSVQAISAAGLAVAFVPALVVVGILYRWALGAGTAVYAMARMLIQLLLIGYALTFIFAVDQPVVIVLLLAMMLVLTGFTTTSAAYVT